MKWLVISSIVAVAPVCGQHVLTKLADLNNTLPMEVVASQGPYDTPVLVGSELWFTTQNGGSTGFGTIAKFSLATNTLAVAYGNFDNAAGNTPQAELWPDGDLLYLTTTRAGTGDRGTLASWNRLTSSYTVLWNSPSNSPATQPNTPAGGVVVVDRGAGGKDLYFMTTNGGPGGSSIGTIQRFNTLSGLVTQVHAFTGLPDSRQPFKGFTKVGNILYFTTLTGGIAGTGSGNGAGTLGRLDVTVQGAETVAKLVDMPLGDGSTRLPAHRPYYRAADHALYFTTTGTATQPGSLQKYDLTTGVLSTLHEIQGAATSAGPFPEGRFCYGFVAEWNRALYYTTMQGGNTGNGGTINRYDLASGQHEVLFHLDATAGNNPGGGSRGGLVFSNHGGSPAFYLTPREGGVHDHGTILKLSLPPEQQDLPAYSGWIQSVAAGLPPADAVPGANPDGDSATNREEFAFGMDPTAADVVPMSGYADEANGFVLRWTGRTDGSVIYVVKRNDDLAGPWVPSGHNPDLLPVPDLPVPPGYGRFQVELPIGLPAAFFRVEATIPAAALP